MSGETPDPGRMTVLLRAAHDGDREAMDEVYRAAYAQLHDMAKAVRRKGPSATINTTALVHEAYLKLVRTPGDHLRDRVHFFSIAARAMRHVLVDAARRRRAAKRGGGIIAASFEESVHVSIHDSGRELADDILTLGEALERLEGWSPRQAEVVECRVFAGLSVEDTARALGVSEPTVKRDWQTARAWLVTQLEE